MEIDPGTLKERLERGDPLVLVDVRTPQEWAIGRLEGARHIPLQELQGRAGELSRDDEIVFICKVGARSARAAELFRQQGFAKALNLQGGLVRWAAEVDPSLLIV